MLRIAALPTSGDSVHYTNDGLNQRIGRETEFGSSDQTQFFLYDDSQRVVAELTTASAVKSVFVYGTKPNVPDYMYQPGSTPVTYRIISDWIGSVRLVVNVSNGAVVQQLDYDEFGNILPSSWDMNCSSTLTTQCFPTQPFGFAGGLRDRDAGLVRFGARDYDPQLGRWASKDPIRFDGGDTNLYVYAADDPINGSDPTGLEVYRPPPPPPPPIWQCTQWTTEGSLARAVCCAWVCGKSFQPDTAEYGACYAKCNPTICLPE